MNRRHFVGITPAMLAGVQFRQSLATEAANGLPPQDTCVTMIAAPILFKAGCDGVSKAFSIDMLPEGTGIRMRTWWPNDSDYGLPNGARFSWDDVEGRGRHVVALLRHADPVSEAIEGLLRGRSRPLTRMMIIPSESWPDLQHECIPASISIIASRHRDDVVVYAPSLWERQLFEQIRRAPASDDGSKSICDIEKEGHPMADIFRRENEYISDLFATVIARTVIDRGSLRKTGCLVAEVRCDVRDRNLHGTSVVPA